ncbi:MAG: phytanoyl-CoA dioxygenase family protein [Planctomycetaceae bacterium]|nr:phytanoyl-CoA dioxygenase family protein [Planctomycetaceae bacterium]
MGTKYDESLDWQAVPLEAGDALFFSSYASHYSGTNLADVPCRALYLTYNASSEGDHREDYYADKRNSLESESSNTDTLIISKVGHFEGKPETL